MDTSPNQLAQKSDEITPEMIQAIQHENEVLKAENEKLNSQFQNALQINEAFNQLQNENASLNKSISDKILEINEHQNKIDILNNKIKLLESKFNDEKTQMIAAHQREILNLQEKIKSYQESISKSEDKYNNQLKDKEMHYKTEISSIQHKIDQIYQFASAYFEVSVDSVDKLQEQFSKPPKEVIKTIETPVKQPQNIQPTKSDSENDFQQQIREVQESVKASVSKEYELKLQEQQKSFEKQLKSFKQAFLHQEKKIQSLQQKLADRTIESDQRLKDMTAAQTQLQITRNEFENMKINEIIKLNSTIENKNAEISKLKAENSKLQEEISELISKSSKIEKKQSQMHKKIDNLEHNYSLSQNENSKLKIQNEKLNSQLNDLTDKYKDQIAVLKSSKQNIESLNEQNRNLKLDLEKSRAEIDFNNETMNNLKSDNEQINKQVADASNKLKELQISIQEKDKVIFELQTERDNIKLENKSIREKLISSTSKIDESAMIPIAYWTCKEFPAELSNIITDISANPTLRTPTKLKTVLSAIAKWYSSRIENLTKDIETEKNKFEELNNNEQRFYTNVNEIFANLKLDQNVTKNKDQFAYEINKYVRELEQNVNSLIQQNKHCDEILFSLYTELDSETPELALETIHEMKQTIDALNSSYQKQGNQISKLESNIQQNEKEKLVLAKEFKREIKKLNSQIKELQTQNENLQSRYEKTANEAKESLSINDKKINDLIIALDSQKQTYEQKLLTLLSEIQKQKDEINEKQSAIRAYIGKEKQYEAQIDELTDRCESKTNEIKELKVNLSNTEKMMKERIDSERKLFEEKIINLSQNNSSVSQENKANVDSLNTKISELQDQHNKEKENSSILQLKIKKLEIELNATKAELEREKLCEESKIKLGILSVETEYQKRLEEMKNSIESTKRNLISQIGLQFSSMFNVSSKLDEGTFESFIKALKSRINFLTEQDQQLRDILELSPSQSIPDAVEKLLISNQQED
ncbi:hypothetical protein TVAG_054090 [Trichomonas vaginalis G3]|uniref:Uncharacterized protein n=1 Tax=Trichomonas vaginalis (strain ATCC PRA-98 / G3) TaxID=412133 RepID=A2FMP7_TRIV3|nr:biological adhesion protein [Trichomonas vaginalis G3]EAX93804.1 hypothetical protein TVAG_054090 [Trichomonas vaginalis G3]KAI5486357.1 biological adhesion protein [Trichomonas vaginalis G3]|eukprot:XP_001306734.1 hypothetical protein [Trichomonas vaginalis G3]